LVVSAVRKTKPVATIRRFAFGADLFYDGFTVSMIFKQAILFVSALAVFIALPTTRPESDPRAARATARQAETIGPIHSNMIAAAENNPQDTENDRSPAAGNSQQDSGSEPQVPEENGRHSDKPKPLKPFIPSEEIPAEQAVDFPVDI
jgi:hypothetical protein